MIARDSRLMLPLPAEADVVFEALDNWLKQLQTGEPRTLGRLTLVPIVHARTMPETLSRALVEAVADGSATVAEAPGRPASSVRITNRGARPLLILAGDEMSGGLSTCIASVSALVPPYLALDLPVSACERDGEPAQKTRGAVGEIAYPRLRQQVVRQVSAALGACRPPWPDQGSIWDELTASRQQHALAATSGTLRAMYTARRDVVGTASAGRRPPRGAVGMICLLDGRLCAGDLFDRPALLRANWSRLVRAYAFEAAVCRAAQPDGDDAAERVLASVLGGRRAVFASVGLGLDVRLGNGAVAGAALVHDGVVVHASFFRKQRRRAVLLDRRHAPALPLARARVRSAGFSPREER